MALGQEEIRTLDQLRRRLVELAQTLQISRTGLLQSDPLPTWQELKLEQDFLVRRISAVQQALNENSDFFTAAHAYPLSTFPGQSREGFLGSILQKKLEIAPREWVAKYSKSFSNQEEPDSLAIEDYESLWQWAAGSNDEFLAEFRSADHFDDDYTIAEREMGIASVKTGLRRKLDDGDSDSDGDEEMEDVVDSDDAAPDGSAVVEPGIDQKLPPVRLETILRFISSGKLLPQ
ncbi:hypothetical protein LTR62_003250 [Meristemomyces frigidus]|uniref:Mediator of RNA polymerase II transcription subunit 8 n=1 Tax=Meristemomyces frigidus TaxID=1508187 RepID=A0AAN7TGB1_9PEZI|nr:hypothetical protein LTR62_003250 [Meristemomyces frigidus]